MKGRDSQGVWDGHGHTAIFKMDNQQERTVYHRELCSMLCGSLDGRGVWGRIDTCICTAESLCCPPETVIALLISYSSGSVSYLVVSDSCRLKPTRFLCPWDSPAKTTGVDCHSAIFQYKIKSLIKKIMIMFGKHCKLGLSQATQDVGLFNLFKTVLIPFDSLAPHGPRSSVYGVLQARIVE